MASARRSSRPGRPSEEDLRLWRHITRDAKPLRSRLRAVEAEAPATVPAQAPGERRPDLKNSTARGALLPAKVRPPAVPELSHGDVAGLDKRKAQRMRRGRLPIEARLDLHGMTQADAHAALSGFVTRSAALGRRCILVITGKGRGGEAGVLRRQVPLWLNQAGMRDKILAFDHARPEHGGQGALYLLLRRQRDKERG